MSVLHVAALDQLLPAAVGGSASCKYVHLLSEVDGGERAGRATWRRWCRRRRWGTSSRSPGNREKMPPKSTYFYPKLLTGLVFNSLKTN